MSQLNTTQDIKQADNKDNKDNKNNKENKDNKDNNQNSKRKTKKKNKQNVTSNYVSKDEMDPNFINYLTNNGEFTIPHGAVKVSNMTNINDSEMNDITNFIFSLNKK